MLLLLFKIEPFDYIYICLSKHEKRLSSNETNGKFQLT